jgi:hypothetical protein
MNNRKNDLSIKMAFFDLISLSTGKALRIVNCKKLKFAMEIKPPKITPNVRELSKIKKLRDARIRRTIQFLVFKSLYVRSQSLTLIISALKLFKHDKKVFKGRDYSKNQKNKEEPRLCPNFLIQKKTDKGSKTDGKCHY